MKTALVLGAGGFIGSHMVKRLREEGFWVRGVDLKFPEYEPTKANDFVIGNLCVQNFVSSIIDRKFDTLVARTKNRPIASGKVSPLEGLVLTSILCFLALIVLVQFNK